jgi:hypothetical protein
MGRGTLLWGALVGLLALGGCGAGSGDSTPPIDTTTQDIAAYNQLVTSLAQKSS